ncbi:ATP synthase subunit J [Lysinibacillus contaminans]|uniref:ATP synthase subunit J n=1 Tax=Lysinibacillus contaminans TaxID=1293441 RepID=A0ABR5JW05_9BACI|nr:TrkH family potassium uptake protein [Lysinibacillus contaminans]KOS66327.1 ATP synthase subunit J [Lysinibacillus contaminans]
MKRVIDNLNPPTVLMLGFAVLILTGSVLLSLPVATESREGLSFLDALFTATSAICVTGLVVVDTGDTFSVFGELVILMLIQIGGLGFMTFSTLFLIIMKKRISLKERLLIKESFNFTDLSGVVKIARRVFMFTLIAETIGGIILAFRFSMDMPVGKAIYFGFFHAISNFNNAGFDLMGGFQSLTMYVDDPIVTITIGLLIILGGIGFIVIHELYEYRQTKRLSLHTKIVLTSTSILVVGATILIFLLEYHNAKTLGTLSPVGKWLGAFFQSVTPRTAGANTLPIADLTYPTLFLTIFLMFVGAGSGSTASGIKVTTLTVLLATLWAQLNGKEHVTLFKRKIVMETIVKAFTITMCGLLLVFTATFILSVTEKGFEFIVYLFEATSAFGTVGLSMGLTPELSPFGRVCIIVMMFIGRLGPLTIAFALTRNRKDDAFHYPKGNIMIG